MMKRLFCLVMLATALSGLTISADDWPQWRGIDRTGISKETGLLKDWPKGGPKLLWEQKGLGGGYSTPSIVGDHLYIINDRKGEEFVLDLSAKNGAQNWIKAIGKVGPNKGPQYPGARATPTVDGEFLYVLGSDGDLACLKKDNGDIVWSKNLRQQFSGSPGMWAYSESVLIDGDHVICTPGGKVATIAALNKKNGSVVWQSAVPEGDQAGYSSIIAVDVDGVRQYIQFLGNGLVGVDAKTGKFLWRYGGTKDVAANIPTPIFRDGTVFTSTSRNGSGLNRIKVGKDEVSTEQVYYNTIKLNSIGGSVLVGDYIYGSNAKGELVCMEFKTGTEKWHSPCVGAASLCAADGMLYVRGHGGSGFDKGTASTVALVEASPDGYHEHGRFEQPDHGKQPSWPHPVVANGCLYLHDFGTLLCYDLKGEK